MAHTLIVAITGDADVGIGAYIERFVNNTFSNDTQEGSKFDFKKIAVFNTEVTLRLRNVPFLKKRFSTAGSYSGVKAAIICYDVTNKESYIHIPNYITEIRQNIKEPIIIIVGLKNDEEEKKQVQTDEAQNMASMEELGLFEASAKTGVNVYDSFAYLTTQLVEKAAPPRTENGQLLYQTSSWLPDNMNPNCVICKSQFTFLNRRHHCRLCGNVICDNCSKHREMLAVWDAEQFVLSRVCDTCKLEKYSKK